MSDEYDPQAPVENTYPTPIVIDPGTPEDGDNG